MTFDVEQLRARLIDETRRAAPDEALALQEKLRTMPAVCVSPIALALRETQFEQSLLGGPPWSLAFLLGKTSPKYRGVVAALTDPQAAFQGQFIVGFAPPCKRLTLILLINRVLQIGGLLLIILGVLINVWLVPVGVGLFAVQYLFFNNLQTLLNIRLFARLSLYSEEINRVGDLVLLGFEEIGSRRDGAA